MADYTPIQNSELRHTYPYGKTDIEVPFGLVKEMKAIIDDVFKDYPECRRVIVAVEQGNLDEIATCEEGGLRYAIDVQTRDGRELSLMVHEPNWVMDEPSEIEDLELS
ncbi:hypothetical protein [Corynebacterium lubricantis]|uniref:hypothetical protein n=1 Tax=Corynebacterium lubricantis TaxID=541095 RepID=UPI000374653C|nr:hypothetical protein [Corynebacterium lubricantis]